MRKDRVGRGAEGGSDAAAEALTGIGERRLAQAHERYDLIRPFLEEGVPLPRIAERSGKTVRTLRAWVSRYREGDVPGLAPKERSDRGRRRVSEEIRNLIGALWLQAPGRSVASVHRRVAHEADLRGWPAPGYDQVRGVVKDLDPSLVCLAREGTNVHKQRYDLLHRFEATEPNEIWQADHKHLSIWLRDEKGNPKKPCLTAIEDDYSRAIPGYHLGFDAPSSQKTSLALRQAIWRKEDPRWTVYGVPDRFYTDNGPDFISKRMGVVAASIKMRLDFSMVGQPRGRGKIERLFKSADRMLLPDLPGFGPKGDPKPKSGSGLLTLRQFAPLFREWLLGFYHLRKHGETKQRPVERWEAAISVPRVPDTLEELDLLLLTEPKTRRVGRDGIRFENHRYFHLTLAPYIGEDVVLRYDPSDMGEVRVYHEGTFLCSAVSAELAGGTYSYRDVKKANAENRQRLRAQRKEIESAARAILSPAKSSRPTSSPPSRQPATEGGAPGEGEKKRKLKSYRNQ